MSEPYHYSRESPEPDDRADRFSIQCSACGYRVDGVTPKDTLDYFLSVGGKAELTPDHTDLTCPKCGHQGRSLTLFGD